MSMRRGGIRYRMAIRCRATYGEIAVSVSSFYRISYNTESYHTYTYAYAMMKIGLELGIRDPGYVVARR